MATIYRQQRHQQTPSALWSALLLVGAAVTVLGLLLVTNPFATAGTLAVLAGVALVLSGIGETMAAVRSENTAGTALLGVLLALGGIVVLLWPGATLRAVALVVGTVLIITGVARGLVAWTTRPPGGLRRLAWPLTLAVLSVALGVLALGWPGATIVVLAVLFGIELIVTGVTEIALGLALRPRTH